MKQSARTFAVRVANRQTGDEQTFEITAGSQMEAEAKCGNDEWLVVSSGSSAPIAQSATMQRPTRSVESAVMYGIVKGFFIVSVAIVLVIFVASIVYGLASI